MRKYFRPAGGGLVAAAVLTAGLYFVTVLSVGHPLPWWPFVLFLGLGGLGGFAYVIGPPEVPLALAGPTATESEEPLAISNSGIELPATDAAEDYVADWDYEPTPTPPPVEAPETDARTGYHGSLAPHFRRRQSPFAHAHYAHQHVSSGLRRTADPGPAGLGQDRDAGRLSAD